MVLLAFASFILGSLLFNIFLCDLIQFFPNLDINNYADDDTPHSTNINLNKSLHDIIKVSKTLFKWFTDNLLISNLEKSDLLTSSTQDIQINIGEMAISNGKFEKSLGIHIDSKLKFEPNLRSVCKKASQNLNAFARTAYCLKFEQKNFFLMLQLWDVSQLKIK